MRTIEIEQSKIPIFLENLSRFPAGMINIQVEPNDFKFVDTFKHEVYEFDSWDEFVSWLKRLNAIQTSFSQF